MGRSVGCDHVSRQAVPRGRPERQERVQAARVWGGGTVTPARAAEGPEQDSGPALGRVEGAEVPAGAAVDFPLLFEIHIKIIPGHI